MLRYLLTSNTADSHQMNPAWVLLFIRFSRENTYNRSSSVPLTLQNVAAETSAILVTHDCIEFEINNSKRGYISDASFTLAETNVLYLDEENGINNGDWVLFWAMNNEQDANTVINQIKQNQRANYANSGLKFIGRVESVFRNVIRDGDQGRRKIRYSVKASAFKELGLSVYYNPLIGLPFQNMIQNGVVQQFTAIGGTDFLTSLTNNGGTIDENKAVDLFIKVFLGQGPFKDFQEITGVPVSSNKFYVIPNTVKSLLLSNSTSNPATYADLLYTLQGIQQYDSTVQNVEQNVNQNYQQQLWSTGSYTPYLKSIQEDGYAYQNSLFTTDDLPGRFYVNTLSLDNVPLWNLLLQFVNIPISELFTTLRVNFDGYIYPTVVHRQSPFSSDLIQNLPISLTKFTNLPRWVIDDSILHAYHLGKSEMMRKNYVHLIGAWADGSSQPQKLAELMGLITPVMDASDIERFGPAPEIKRLPFISVLISDGSIDQTLAKYDYGKLMMDIWKDGEKRLSGTIVITGRQEPIAVGDNIEYNGNLYHIEGITHAGNLNIDKGERSFITTLRVSFGTSIKIDTQNNKLKFPNLDDNHSATYDPFGAEYLGEN